MKFNQGFLFIFSNKIWWFVWCLVDGILILIRQFHCPCLNLDLNQKNGFSLMILVPLHIHRKSPAFEQGWTPVLPPVKLWIINAVHQLDMFYMLFIIQIVLSVCPSKHMLGLHFLLPLWLVSYGNSSSHSCGQSGKTI